MRVNWVYTHSGVESQLQQSSSDVGSQGHVITHTSLKTGTTHLATLRRISNTISQSQENREQSANNGLASKIEFACSLALPFTFMPLWKSFPTEAMQPSGC